MDILVTSFTPFNGMEENMSAKVMELLPEKAGENVIRRLLLPTSYDRCVKALKKWLEENPADGVVLTGQAPREKITVERVAINVGDSSIADNDGVMLRDTPLVNGGPAAYFSTLPIKEMCRVGDGQISNTAGTYVCNALMYKALDLLNGKIPCGFVHLPQNGSAPLLAEQLAKMIGIIV